MGVVDSKDYGLSAVPGGSDDQRGAGPGLLSRFLGAVFLVLVCGLLLLDQALLQANRDQTVLDAQAASLLIERVIAEEALLLKRIASDPAVQVDDIVQAHAEVRAIWKTDTSGRVHPLYRADSTFDPVLLPVPRTGVSVITRHDTRGRLILLREELGDSATERKSGTFLLVSSDVLQKVIERLEIPSRIALSVLAGDDTVAFVGDATRQRDALSKTERTIRLPDGGAWSITATHALASRTLRWALWILGVLGIAFLAIGLLREQKRAIQAAGRSTELERLYSDVKRANQAKSEFLANVSHELRTPLNAIVGFVELLREGFYGDLSPRQVPPVDRIAASATHLRHLVDQVLDIAKIAAGRLEVHPETIVLRPFVLNIASELESLVSEKGLTFSITVGASLPRVRTDPSHLRQILINLIGNAVKYTQTGTISIRARPVLDGVRTSASNIAMELATKAPKPGSWIALQVVDTGVGIAASDLERIFDEFEQVNAGPRGDSMQRGTGLGLAISRRLARLLGGEISVESEFGKGSTFTVWLPVNAADLIRDPAVMPPELPDAPA